MQQKEEGTEINYKVKYPFKITKLLENNIEYLWDSEIEEESFKAQKNANQRKRLISVSALK